jgi:hypothetical protein
MDERLRNSLVRMGRKDAMFFGHALARLRQAIGVSVEQQATTLGLTPSGLAFLSMCKVPHPDHRDDDLAVVSGRVGLSPEVLADLLRQAAGLDVGQPTAGRPRR